MISLACVQLTKETEELVCKVVRENAIGQSVYIEQFEAALCAFTGAKYTIAVCNGSMADIVLLAAMKEIYNCRQVIIPALTFIAQPNAARINGLEIIWCDVQEDMLIDDTHLDNLLTDDNPVVLFKTDLMGRTIELEDSLFPVIEDACEAFGSNNVNQESMASTFSFYPSHALTTGEGGAIITNNLRIAEMCRSIRNHGRMAEWTSEAPFNKFHFERFGFNGKMSALQAAIGLSQMATIGERIARRKEVYKILCNELHEHYYEGICPHGMPLRFGRMDYRDTAMCKLTEAGVECRKLFSCIPYREPYYIARKR